MNNPRRFGRATKCAHLRAHLRRSYSLRLRFHPCPFGRETSHSQIAVAEGRNTPRLWKPRWLRSGAWAKEPPLPGLVVPTFARVGAQEWLTSTDNATTTIPTSPSTRYMRSSGLPSRFSALTLTTPQTSLQPTFARSFVTEAMLLLVTEPRNDPESARPRPLHRPRRPRLAALRGGDFVEADASA